MTRMGRNGAKSAASWAALGALALALAAGPQGCSWFRKSKKSDETRLPTPELGSGPGIAEPGTGPDGSSLPGDMARDRMPANPELLSNSELTVIYFDFDKSDLRRDQIAGLEANAAWVKEHGGVKVLLEGHCDERGTNEYNLALGERRADAVKAYLVSAGIDPASLNVISYGEERPAATGSDEGAWAENRRVVFMPFK